MCIPLVLVWFPWIVFKLSAGFLLISLTASALKVALGYMLMIDPKKETAKRILGQFRHIMVIQIVSWCLI
jgi:hypothetical protein